MGALIELLVIGLGVGGVGLLTWKAWTAARERVLLRVAAQLGLRTQDGGITGRVDGIEVFAEVVEHRRGEMTIRCVARLRPRLGLGLRIHRRTFLDDFLGRIHHDKNATAAEQHFYGRALHHDQLRRIFRSPFGERLIDAKSYRVEVTDEFLEAEVETRGDPAPLVELVKETANLASRLLEARRRLPPSNLDRALAAVWEPLSVELGGDYDPDTGSLHAEIPSGELSAWVENVDTDRWRTLLSLRFARPVGFELRLTNESPGPRWLPKGLADVRIGDAAFDDEFLLQVESDAKDVFTDEARAKILELSRDVTNLLLTHEGLDVGVDEAVRSRDRLQRIVDGMRGVATLLCETRPPRGPYR